MMHLMQQFEYLKIQLKAIKLATKNFANENCIGRGGFGKVYKGELVHYKGKEIVAIKRLDPVFGQGNPEFWREIIMLSLYKHDNIVSLLGFCDESDEKILVYEYASRRSLDSYLNKDDLIWIQRLNICIGAARGLAYLHNPFGTQQRVLHRDIKSSNILLDENWNAKISDLGLSKFGPANQDYTFLVTNGVGTIGYCDPLYMETGLLTKESDVYSFGVVLFEVLCGRLCIGNKNGIHRPLTGLVRQYYPQNKINEIIFGKIKDEMNPKSLEVFTTIAYRCLSRDLEERPMMTDIVSILESALKYQLELNSFDLKNNPIQSSSYEQGETTHEKSSDMLVLMLCSIGVWEGFYPLRNKWIRLPIIPADECFKHSQQESLAVGSELLVFGRELVGYVIWKYSFIRRQWVRCEGINHPRCLFGSGTLGSIAIVAGGCDKNGNILKSAELYDSSTGRWEILPDMHSPRRLCSSFFMDKKFYVIGGITSSTDHSLTCGEEFDLNTKHWRKIDGMYPIIVKKVAQAPPLVAVVSNELYALDYLSSMVKKYDKNKNTWDVLGRLPIKASSMEGWSLVFKACGDRLLVVYVQKSLENASIVLNSWSPKSRIEDGILDWNVLGVKEQESQFVYDCAVMGC